MRKEMLARQEEELLGAEEAFEMEKEQQDNVWDEKISKYEEDLAEAVSAALALPDLCKYKSQP